MRLRTKIILLVSLTALCVGLLSALAVSRIMRTSMEREIEHKGILVAETLSEFLTYYVVNEEILPARDALQKIVQPAEGVSFAYITGFDGNIFAYSFEGGFPKSLASKIRLEANTKDILLDRYITNEGPILEVRYPLIAGMRGRICIAMNMNFVYEHISAIRNRIMGLTFGITLLGIMLGVILSRRISGPLGRLMESMQAFGQGTSGEEIVLPGANREVAELTGTFNRMISDRKRAEDYLRKSENKYRTLIENLPQKIFYKDRKSVFISCNKNLAYDLRIKPDEIVGKTDYDFFPKELAEKYRADDKRLMDMGKAEDIEEKYIQDKQEVWIYTIKTPVMDDSGNVAGILGIFWDITERKRAEEKLRKRERQLLESQRVAHLGSWDLNLVSEELEWSNETYRLFDRSPEDFVPSFNEFARLVHPGDHATMETNFFRALESDANPYHVAVRIINDSGREWVMEAFGVVRRDPSGKALSIFGTAQDITERKKAEEQVQQSLHEKETLLRELYHRTKNNMQVIISLLNLQSGGIDDKKTIQILEDTKNRIQSMALVHEKLYKAKNLSQVYLGDYIKDLADALMKSHNGGNEQISLQVDVESIPVSIDTITPLGLVMNELMTNALKYAFPDNKKGDIIIKALMDDDGIIELTFSDNGIGIPESIDFAKAESLGLKMVRTLVELQIKGKMEIETQNGTKFIIRFRDKGIPAGI